MTEKRDKLIEALMPEEQQDVNAVLAKIEPLHPRLKYAITLYFSLEPSERHPNIIEVEGSTPIDEADEKIFKDAIRHIFVSMNRAQHRLVCHDLDNQLKESGFVYQSDGRRQYVRIQQ